MAQNYLLPDIKYNHSTKRIDSVHKELYVAVHKGLRNDLDVYYIAYNNRFGNPVAYLAVEIPNYDNNFESAQAALDVFANKFELEPKYLPKCPLCQHDAIITQEEGLLPITLVGCVNKECLYFAGLPLYADRKDAVIDWVQIANSKLVSCKVCGKMSVFNFIYSMHMKSRGLRLWKVVCSTHACFGNTPVPERHGALENGFYRYIPDAAASWNKENS